MTPTSSLPGLWRVLRWTISLISSSVVCLGFYSVKGVTISSSGFTLAICARMSVRTSQSNWKFLSALLITRNLQHTQCRLKVFRSINLKLSMIMLFPACTSCTITSIIDRLTSCNTSIFYFLCRIQPHFQIRTRWTKIRSRIYRGISNGRYSEENDWSRYN